MKSILHIHVLGPFEVLDGIQPVELPQSKKTRALLAYLAVVERPARRERLCEMFWELPDDPKAALRWSLSKIRRALNGGAADRISSDRATIALDRSAVDVDWKKLKQAATDGFADLSTDRLEALETTLRGGFLEDLSLSQCPDFEAWRLTEAAHVEEIGSRLLRILIERLWTDPERALRPALKLRSLVPDPEEGEELIKRLRERMTDARSARVRVTPAPVATPAAGTSSTGASPHARTGRPEPRIIVLPFRTYGTDDRQGYVADGITEDLTTMLSRVLGLFVIARDTAFAYRDTELRVADIAKDLGVRYALHGTVRIEGDRVRATAYLVDSITGFEIWAERYDASVRDVFALQDQIVTAVVRALQLRLLEGAQAHVWHRSTESVEAWACLTQGLAEYKHQTREGVIAARHLFSRAVEIDPNYAAAWAWLAYCHWHDARFLWNDRPEQSLARASDLAERALSLDDQLSEVHGVVGAIRVLQRDFDEAVGAARKAVELSPNSSEAVALLSFVLNWAGEPREAERFAEKAMATCPLYSGWYGATLAHAQRLLGRFETARSSYEAVIRDLPGYIMPRLGLTVCLFEMGAVDAAKKEAAEALRLVPGFSVSRHLAMSAYRKEEHSARRLRAFQALQIVDR